MRWKCYIFSVYMLKTVITITSILLTAVIILSYISIFNVSAAAISSFISRTSSSIANNFSIKEYQVPPGSHPHDVAPIIANQVITLLFGLLLKQQDSWAN